MKKTLSSILITSAIVTSALSSANAATSGTLNFTGAVSDGTCTVGDLNQTVSFSDLSTRDIKNLNQNATIEKLEVNYNVSGCPPNINNARLKVVYPHAGNSRADLGTTTMRGAAVMFRTSTQTNGWASTGYTEDFAVTNGSASVKFTPHLIRVTSGVYGELEPVAGNFSTTTDLELSFN
ncbi:type 1 fimbrial protein [Pantoea sp. B9002]|uniref:fimbrial protein n=1 Tax=Pantoea sp. B9002 TaxID=2726979 RepID=UPI0015A22BBA|nr:type 1 fimbrial protein [Pantoea sp. B9002]NWA62459.1 type 1 fimbrial protein [Pantoea sp. B9002]